MLKILCLLLLTISATNIALANGKGSHHQPHTGKWPKRD